MSALRIYRQRALRLDLSSRYQLLRRAESTSTTNTTSTTATTATATAATAAAASASARRAASKQPPKPSFIKRNFSRIAWAWFGGMLGVVGGTLVVHTLAPPKMPEAGTHQDNVLMADLDKRIDEEFKVKVLRGKCLGVAKQLKGEEGGWLEIIGLPSLTESSEPARQKDGDDAQVVDGESPSDLIEQLQGAGGLGVERLFWDRGERQLVAVVWLGGSLCGWPGVIHGGVIGTALTEKTALANLLSDHEHTDILAAATPQRLPGTGNHAKMLYPASKPEEPVELSLGYVKPTHANQFFVIRVAPHLALDEIRGNMVPVRGAGGLELDAILETLDGKVCAKAKATFAPAAAAASSKPESKSSVGAAVHSSYAEFKAWLWPSRQKNSQI